MWWPLCAVGLVALLAPLVWVLVRRVAQAGEQVRQAHEELRAVIEASPLAILALDLKGNVTSWNPAAERIFGWRQNEVVGRLLPLIAENEMAAFRDRLERAKRGATMYGIEVTQRRKDDSPVEVSLWSAALRGASGAPRGFIVLAADISERKWLEEQLRQSHKMEAVGRLAGGVSHDFNNLLTVITGYGYMLLDDLGEDSPLRGSVEEILRAVERASALTGQLLAFSRRQAAQPRKIDLTALVASMDRMLRRVIGEDIELVTELSPELGTVTADPGQMEQVVMNLVLNARDAMPAGGQMTIRTANAEPERLGPGARILLSVSDSGAGMDEETKAHLFEPFFTTKAQGKGTGLGMSTVYGIVKQSGGEIVVESELGRGTSITIYLPRDESAPQDDAGLPPQQDVERGSETVLLVEDEDEVRRLVRGVLVERGYTVIESAQPEEAVRLCQDHPGTIHLLLTDMVMPQMNGRQLAERAQPVRPKMKVLYMSGYAGDENATEDLGAPLLRKPFTPSDLARAVREVLDGRQGNRG
jgi:two-component system cell cycle sensor histidine kinase/response regulator CckA